MIKILSFFALVLFTLSANAQLLGLQYIDTNNKAVEKSPSQLQNPASSIDILITAGLSRTISYDLLKNNILIDSGESSIISVNDRFTFEGADYYGKIFTTTNTLDDGVYSINYSLKDASGEVVSTGQSEITIDKQPPTYTKLWAASGYGTTAGYAEIWKLGLLSGSHATKIRVEDISDNNSINEITYKLYRENGDLYKEGGTTYDQVNAQAILEYSGIFPKTDLDEAFQLIFLIEDAAGNITQTPFKTLYFDNTRTSYIPFAIFDPESTETLVPGLTGYVPYISGMTVKTNPIKIAYKIPKSSWNEYNPGGMFFQNALGPTEFVHTDKENIYFATQLPFGNTNSNYVRFRNYGQWSGSYVNYNLVLDENTPKTPVLVKSEFLTDKKGWISATAYTTINNSELPIVISKIRITGQVRIFDQLASHHSTKCTIPAGQTSCEADYNYTLADGNTAFLHSRFLIQSIGVSTPELASNPRWAEITYNDRYYPEFTDTSFDEVSKELTVLITQQGAGSYFDRLRLNNIWIEYNGNNVPYKSISRNGIYYEAKFDYTTLPEGTYKLVLHAQERHGPKSSLDLGLYFNDKTKPVISLTNNGDGNFSELNGLEHLLLAVQDSSEVQINSISLSGGPAKDIINMASIKQSSSNYSLEYPRIFPALVEDEQYTITINVTDSFLNTSTYSKSFMYRPNNLNDIGLITTLAVNKMLYLPDNTPLTTISSDVLRDEFGNIANGPQTLYITLRSDASFPIVIHGITVNAGETKEIQTDVSHTSGKLNIPVYPGISGVVGSAPFMVYIPAIEFSRN